MSVFRVVLAILALYLAVCWHQSLLGQSSLLGFKIDFVLVSICLVSVRLRPAVGALYGFAGGFASGAAAGANLTALTVSRTILGFALGFLRQSGTQLTWVHMALVTAIGTAISQILLLFMAPPPDIGAFIGATIGTAIYNGVFAGLADLILRRTMEPQVD